ncbi:hypothetical protein ASD97_24595 [Streptomyces sp. Root63]|uniref:hypothetical protein n=1 Tax=unclassified Streptomyces TaxID=2593676 RepID=UPI0006FACE93|nr:MULTISPECIES: hypothetical protein [unclassified Streptomyces]KQX27485.1 hypothetical protein ASD29_29825 [Streptomyces sp. Root1295]KRA34725.1 hypothetical protein ASD97_24595 [Streptomyces sp. Root63]
MTGPEHYREAERLLKDEYRTAQSIADAQVHATLALAAATALPPGVNSPARTAWGSVTEGEQPDYDVRNSFA